MARFTGDLRMMKTNPVFVVMKTHGIRILSPYDYGYEKEFLRRINGNPIILMGRKSIKKESLVCYCVAKKLYKIYKYGNLKVDSLSIYPEVQGSVVLVDSSTTDVKYKHIFKLLRLKKEIVMDVLGKLELQEIFGKNIEYLEEEGVIIDVNRDKFVGSNTARQGSEVISFAE